MRATVVTIVIAALSMWNAAAARAQSHIEAVPSVTIGTIYDDNLFAQQQGDAGQMLTVRPGLGTAIDVPLGHKDAAFVRSHFDAMEARVSDAPRANEIVVAVVVTDSGRPLPRIGGLQASEIKGEDGLR